MTAKPGKPRHRWAASVARTTMCEHCGLRVGYYPDGVPIAEARFGWSRDGVTWARGSRPPCVERAR